MTFSSEELPLFLRERLRKHRHATAMPIEWNTPFDNLNGPRRGFAIAPQGNHKCELILAREDERHLRLSFIGQAPPKEPFTMLLAREFHFGHFEAVSRMLNVPKKRQPSRLPAARGVDIKEKVHWNLGDTTDGVMSIQVELFRPSKSPNTVTVAIVVKPCKDGSEEAIVVASLKLDDDGRLRCEASHPDWELEKPCRVTVERVRLDDERHVHELLAGEIDFVALPLKRISEMEYLVDFREEDQRAMACDPEVGWLLKVAEPSTNDNVRKEGGPR